METVAGVGSCCFGVLCRTCWSYYGEFQSESGADETGIPEWTGIVYSSFHARCGTYYCPLPISHWVHVTSDKRTRDESCVRLRRGKLFAP